MKFPQPQNANVRQARAIIKLSFLLVHHLKAVYTEQA